MSDKIKEALTKLDVSNANHWTQDGQAKLETVKFLSGGESISREELDKAYPGFNKTSASEYFKGTGPQGGGDLGEGDQNPGQNVDGVHVAIDIPELPPVTGTDAREGDTNHDPKLGAANPEAPDQRPGQDAEGNITGVQAPEGRPTPPELHNPAVVEPVRAPGTSGLTAAAELTESPRDGGAGAAAQASQPGDDGAVASEREQRAREAEQSKMDDERIAGTNEVADLEEELEEVEEGLSQLNRHLDSLTQEKDKYSAHADKLRGRLSQLRGSDSTNTIQAYLESRKRSMEQRGENRQTLKESGLTLKKIAQAVAAAPIDQAMARKTGRGNKRPSRV